MEITEVVLMLKLEAQWVPMCSFTAWTPNNTSGIDEVYS